MKKSISILVACGSGIATSTIAADEVKNICQEYDITNYKINKCSMTDLSRLSKQADIVLTTNNYKGQLTCPVINVTGFITGINTDSLRKKVGQKLQEMYNI